MGLNDMNGRIQDAVTGRFLSPDTTVPHPGLTQSFNRYSYARNNPLTFTDPTGFADDPRPLVRQYDAPPGGSDSSSGNDNSTGDDNSTGNDDSSGNDNYGAPDNPVTVTGHNCHCGVVGGFGPGGSGGNPKEHDSPQHTVIPGLPDRTPAYTTRGPFTTPDGKQWYVFDAAKGWSFDDSAKQFNGDDASNALTAPTETAVQDSEQIGTATNRKISVSLSGDVVLGPPPNVTLPTNSRTFAPAPIGSPSLQEPTIDVPMPNREIDE